MFLRPRAAVALAPVESPPVVRPIPKSAPPLAIAPFDAKQARAHQEAWAKHLGLPVERTNSIGMKFVLIPPGEFVMGSPADEQGRRLGEGPQHRVQILQPFYLGRYEVTQAEYQQVTRDNPSMTAGAGNGRLPVEEVSWDEVTQFCQRLGQAEGKSYRLPTEAEWEFACRPERRRSFRSATIRRCSQSTAGTPTMLREAPGR